MSSRSLKRTITGVLARGAADVPIAEALALAHRQVAHVQVIRRRALDTRGAVVLIPEDDLRAAVDIGRRVRDGRALVAFRLAVLRRDRYALRRPRALPA